jgi:hypothetical protein
VCVCVVCVCVYVVWVDGWGDLTGEQQKAIKKLVAKGAINPQGWQHLSNEDLAESLKSVLEDEEESGPCSFEMRLNE